MAPAGAAVTKTVKVTSVITLLAAIITFVVDKVFTSQKATLSFPALCFVFAAVLLSILAVKEIARWLTRHKQRSNTPPVNNRPND